ncbi:MAG: flavoprotein, partial [Pseudomonadota bacterium]
ENFQKPLRMRPVAKKLIKQKKSLPKDLSVGKLSQALKGKKIALAISGGIGATEAVKIAREIRRHGAYVKAFVSPQARKFITPLSVEWATLEKPVLKAGPQVEYLEVFDAVLVCPATLHTLAKSALGLAQNVVDLVIANQLGALGNVLMVPAMNQQLWDHPSLKGHLEKLKSWGAKLYPSHKEEDRIKVPEAKILVQWLIEELR